MSERSEAMERSDTCIFCAGKRPTATAEHCPPQGMFFNREYPKGYLWPSCEECNNGTGLDDGIFQMLVWGSPGSVKEKDKEYIEQHFNYIERKFPGLKVSLVIPRPKMKQIYRKMGVPDGMTVNQATREIPLIDASDQRVQNAVGTVARKLGLALYFDSTGQAVSESGSIMVKVLTNQQFMSGSAQNFLNSLRKLTLIDEQVTLDRNTLDFDEQLKIFSLTMPPEFPAKAWLVRIRSVMWFYIATFGDHRGLDEDLNVMRENGSAIYAPFS